MPITKRVQYRYDSVRNKIGMTDPDGGLFTYTYDVMRRLAGVINPLGERTTYAYDLNGRRTSVQLANGTRTSYVYDVASRVQSVHTLKSDDSTVSKFEYAYDGNGRRTSVLEADGSRVTWTYDSISQVTSEWRTGTNPHRHTFTYDKCGNRTLKIEDGQRTTLVYDACNQLLTSEDTGGTTTFSYDGNGNQTVVQKPSGDRTTQVWDYENRLVKTIQPSGGVTSMAYDADGLRLKKEEPGKTTLFVWDDQNYLAETDAAGTTETAFTTEPSTYGSLISHRKAGASTTYHFDALGSTRALTDESEAVMERYNYTAFGTLLGSPALLTPFLWGGMVGYYWDAALATQYIRARHYQPAIARWISLDPIGFAGGDANLFRYVGNSPTSGGADRRVRLTAAAYGQWQLAVSPTVWGVLALVRMYEGRNGWFLTRDLISFEGSEWNLYELLNSRSLSATDPLGLFGPTGGLSCFTDCNSFVKSLDPASFVVPGKRGTTCHVMVTCDPKCPGLGYAGYPNKDGVISVCLNPSMSRTLDYELVFNHEYQHAKDYCKDPPENLPPGSKICKQCRKYETSAHSVNCGMLHAIGSPEFQACVKCGVWASCKLSKACPKAKKNPKCNSWADLGVPDPGVPFPE